MHAKMDSKDISSDFEPITSMVHEEDCDTILICLPGFRKNHLRVQLLPTQTLKISGERQTGDSKWIRFEKEYPVSTNCDTSKITAKFEVKEHDVGILYIRQPMLITSAAKSDEENQENEAEKPEQNQTDRHPQLPKSTKMKKADKMRDETKSSEKFGDGDEVTSEYDDAEDGDLARKSQENEKKPRKGGVKNDEKGKRKRLNEFESGELATGKVKMAKKVGLTMSVVVVVLSAIALGFYVKNLIMSGKNNSLVCKV